MKRLFWMHFITLICVSTVLAQSRLSPKLEEESRRRIHLSIMDTFSIAVKDKSLLMRQYGDRVKVLTWHQGSSTLTFCAARNLIFDELMENENILFIDAPDAPKEESVLDVPDFRYNRIRKIQHQYPNLQGSGLRLSLKERTFDVADIDLVGKTFLIGLEAEDVSQHATDMATIILGSGHTSPLYKGVATAAMIAPSDFNNLLPDDETVLTQNEIYLQNHSYGVGIENYYGVEAYAYDQSIFSQPEIVHVFSAGNAGTSRPEDGIYSGLSFANLTGTFKQAKNTLIVSAVDTSLAVSPYNSRGPAFDGRVKPELTAYGGGGTSDAAAIVSGIVTLLQEAFQDKTLQLPTSAMIKAVLIAGADDIGPHGIDFYSGYGSANASKSRQILESGWHHATTVHKGENTSLEMEVPAGVSQIKVAVSWVDPPAELNTTSALINDVDALLTYEGATWLPWILDHSPSEAALNRPSQRGSDHLNNTEFFSLESPQAGPYQLQLSGTNLSSTSQDVSIAWYFEMADTFDWDFPTSSDILPANNSERLIWNSTLAVSEGLLAYQLADEEWVDLGAVDLKEPFSWLTPDTSATVRLKMTVGANEFISDYFSLSELPAVSVAFNCEETFGLQWPQIGAAQSYEVYEMGATSLNLIGTTTDTIYTIDKSASVYYSVAPVIGNASGLRSLALNYTFQGTFCYFNFFAAERASEETVRVTLNLSTSANIEHIEVLRFVNAIEEIWTDIVPAGQTSFVLSDNDLDPGLMAYQAVLYFKDGSHLQSEESALYIERPGQVMVFPNPTAENYINLLSSGTGQVLQIMDDRGKLVLEKKLVESFEYIIVQDFSAGLYLYRLMEGEKVVDTGKFIKR
ncbi:S8 family peptidase [Marinoscillum sp.]|uniref:S8 family peptidase n=1 Tax=Marinoscillum sp. TaxID=2024838 RepID=UPI003BAB9150